MNEPKRASGSEILTPGFVRTEGVFRQYEANCKLCNGPILKGEAKKLTDCDHVCTVCFSHLLPKGGLP